MGILQDIESLKYRQVLDLLNHEETYDKKRSVLTAQETFKLFYNRYLLMQEVLLPLREKMGDGAVITDINFTNGLDDDISMVIKYRKGEKQEFLALSSTDFQDIELISSNESINNQDFITTNRKMIFRTFRKILDNSLTEEISVKSTTGKFILKDNCDSLTIKDSDEKIFSIESKYSEYKGDDILPIPSKIECNFPKLKELLVDEKNRLALYNHLRVYEDVFPDELTKKLTYR